MLFGFIPDTAVRILNILLDNTFLSAKSHIAEIRIAPIMKLNHSIFEIVWHGSQFIGAVTANARLAIDISTLQKMQNTDQRRTANRIDERAIPGMRRKSLSQGNQNRHREHSGDKLVCVEIGVESQNSD